MYALVNMHKQIFRRKKGIENARHYIWQVININNLISLRKLKERDGVAGSQETKDVC